MRGRILAVISAILPFVSTAQNQTTQSQLLLTRLQTLTSIGLYNSIDQLGPEASVIGSPYLDDNWQLGSIVLREGGDPISNVPLRYDIHSDMFEIKVGIEVRGMDGIRVKNFSLFPEAGERVFVRSSDFKTGEPISGFMEILENGNVRLLQHSTVNIVKPDYSQQMNVGSRDFRVVKKQQLYYNKKDYAYPVPKGKKKLAEIFDSRADEVLAFIRDKRIDLKTEAGLRDVFRFYNHVK